MPQGLQGFCREAKVQFWQEPVGFGVARIACYKPNQAPVKPNDCTAASSWGQHTNVRTAVKAEAQRNVYWLGLVVNSKPYLDGQ